MTTCLSERPFTVIDAPQRSPEWFSARSARVTGSKASIIQMGADTAGREDYLMQLALESMTGIVEPEGYVSKEMQRGIEKEPEAKSAIEVRDGSMIINSGFLSHKKLMIGISLDGHFGDYEKTLEVKCGKSKTHLKYLKAKSLPRIYVPQCMHGLYVTGAKEGMFCSFDDRMPAGLELFTYEFRAQDLPMAEYEKTLLKFLDEVENTKAELRILQRGYK